MSFRRPILAVILLCSLSMAVSSCVVRRRLIVRKGSNAAQPLLVADKEALLEAISRQYRSVHDFSATVDMVPALGSAEKSKITEYKDVRAYILFRKPAFIRIIGLYPVVRNKAFDMTSDGARFELYIPSRDEFIEGNNELTQPSKNKLENLRPQHFVDALLVRPVDEAVDQVALENFTDEAAANYILLVLHQENGAMQLRRSIWFNRVNLEIVRQLIFDAAGNILTDARYSEWHAYDKVPFPKHVEINRPQDEYGVVIDIVKMELNKGVTDDKFVLEQPAGTKLRVLGQVPAAPAGQTPASSTGGKTNPD
ncbi:MAG: LolA family protein [Bryobacteraceae bacterium]